jgi:hypothetical protein
MSHVLRPRGDHSPQLGQARSAICAGIESLGIGHRPVFFSPGCGGQKHMRASADRIGRAHIIRNDEEIEAGQCAHISSARGKLTAGLVVRARGAALFGDGGKVWRDLARRGKRRFETFSMRSDKGVVNKPAIGQVNQKAAEQNTV